MLSSFKKLTIATEATKTWNSNMKMPGIVSGNSIFKDDVLPVKSISKDDVHRGNVPDPKSLSGKSLMCVQDLSLCQFINSSEYINFPNVNSCFRFDPHKFNGNTKEIRDLFVRDIYEAARRAGFPIDHKYRDNAKIITFTCSHNRPPQQQKQWDESLFQKPGTKKTVFKQVKSGPSKKKGSSISIMNDSHKLPIGQNKHSVR